MAMAQWFGAVARGVMAAERRSPSLTSSMAVEGLVPILCGRGDKRTKRGKRFKGSYGNARPKKEKKIQRIKDKIEGSIACNSGIDFEKLALQIDV
ncbi:hypothetical protein Csa_020557 [Cucumis sativus]|nr:hypothetical protein Csa_020557 [Cucumis sativus]